LKNEETDYPGIPGLSIKLPFSSVAESNLFWYNRNVSDRNEKGNHAMTAIFSNKMMPRSRLRFSLALPVLLLAILAFGEEAERDFRKAVELAPAKAIYSREMGKNHQDNPNDFQRAAFQVSMGCY
jgi:hypothetical protein